MSNPLPHDTPTKARVNPTDPSYHGTSVERSLDVLLRDTPEIPEVTLESLLSAVVPALSETDDDQVYSGLIASGSVDDRRSVWTCMTANPTSSTEAEGVTFGPLKTIFDQVVSAAGINDSRIKFDLKGSKELESDPTNSSRPDAYLRLSTSSFQNSRSQRNYWVDVVMPIEFKKGLNDAKCRDDLRKVVWQMHHIMRSDPRRRFVFGLTIENTSARLWFLDRSDIVTSEVYDIHKDWRTLARLFLRMARASSEELGYDSQCEAVRTQPHCYDFTFEKVENGITIKTVYRTVSLISDLGATSLLGHGTRVWKVQKVVGGRPIDKFYALRDVWPYDDREAEHLIVQKVKEANPEDAIHFLTITDAEFVSVLYNGQRTLDNTLWVIQRGMRFVPTGVRLNTSVSQSAPNTPSQTQDQGGGGTGGHGKSRGSRQSYTGPSTRHPPMVEALPPRGHRDVKYLNLHPRRHYRMVSEEIGTSIYHMRHFPRALIAIRGALKGLRAIHRTKLNHRDVSAGNILYYQGPNDLEPRGIIMDLEYAEEHSINSKPHDVKAGTAAFMAVEVSAGRYRHDQSRLPPSQRTNQTRKTIRTAGLAFRQNSLHDYESIWWIAIWLLFSLFEPGRLRTRAYVSNYEQVFKSSANDRWLFWGESDTFALLSGHLDSELEQDYLFTMELWAEALRRLYNQSYQAGQFEAQDPEIIQQAHQLGLQTIEKLILIVSNYSNELVFFTELPEAAPSTPTPNSSILPMASLSLEPISHAKPRSTRSEKEREYVAV